MSVTETEEDRSSEAEEKDPRFKLAKDIAAGDSGLEMVAHAAQGAELDDEEERDALDFLLGAPQPVVHEIPVQYETPDGMRPLRFVIRSIDTKKIDRIETKHIEPDGSLNRIDADLEIVAEATVTLKTPRRDIELASEEFRTVLKRNPETGERESVVLASTVAALEFRFRDQLGLLNGVTLRIKQAAGYGGDRVGRAKRMMVGAALG